jgi:hypothetical protein
MGMELLEQQTVEQLAPPMTPPPQGVWEALWPAVASVMTPALVGAFVMTVAITHFIKLITPVAMPHVTSSEELWRAYCSTVSVIVGAGAGTLLWVLSHAQWPAIPIVAFGTGLLGRVLLAILPNRVGAALMTDADRKWKQEEMG